MRYRLPRGAVAPGLLLSLAANAALAAPPGILSSNLELVAYATEGSSLRKQDEDRGTDALQEVFTHISDVADASVMRTWPAARSDVDASEIDTGRPQGLNGLVVEFLESL